jgi:hypothetical protein
MSGPPVSARCRTAALSLTLSHSPPLIPGPRCCPAQPVSRSRTASTVPRCSPLFVQQCPLGEGSCQPSCAMDRCAGPPLSFFSCLHVDTPMPTPFFPLSARATEPISFNMNASRRPSSFHHSPHGCARAQAPPHFSTTHVSASPAPTTGDPSSTSDFARAPPSSAPFR